MIILSKWAVWTLAVVGLLPLVILALLNLASYMGGVFLTYKINRDTSTDSDFTIIIPGRVGEDQWLRHKIWPSAFILLGTALTLTGLSFIYDKPLENESITVAELPERFDQFVGTKHGSIDVTTDNEQVLVSLTQLPDKPPLVDVTFFEEIAAPLDELRTLAATFDGREYVLPAAPKLFDIDLENFDPRPRVLFYFKNQELAKEFIMKALTDVLNLGFDSQLEFSQSQY